MDTVVDSAVDTVVTVADTVAFMADEDTEGTEGAVVDVEGTVDTVVVPTPTAEPMPVR